jgi:hypothetical protein
VSAGEQYGAARLRSQNRELTRELEVRARLAERAAESRQAVVERAKVAVRASRIEGAQHALRAAVAEYDGSTPWPAFLAARADALQPQLEEAREAMHRG